MQDVFKIWVDRLGEGRIQKIAGSFAPGFLDIDEKELQFRAPVLVAGEAYLADQHLVIHLKAKTLATLPCAICNEMKPVELKVDNFYHSEAIGEIDGAVFDFSAPLREALLIELPSRFECSEGRCPERASLAPYLQRKATGPKGDGQNRHFPFADLN